MAKILYPLLWITLLHICVAYKILVVFPFAAKSHNILGQGYVKHLLEAGHEVTYVTPYPTNKTNAKYHEVDLSDNVKVFQNRLFTLKNIINKENKTDMMSMLPNLIDMTKICIYNENLINFLSDTTQEFDVLIVEWLFTNVFAGFASLYGKPLIWSSSLEAHGWILQLVHESHNPSFNSDVLSSAIPPFSFYDRTVSLFRVIGMSLVKFFYLESKERQLFEEFFTPLFEKRGKKLPDYDQMLYNASFMLTNSHSSLSQPISVPPNVKEIGGYHIDSNTKPLPACPERLRDAFDFPGIPSSDPDLVIMESPQEYTKKDTTNGLNNLQKIMDEAKDGVIYFSMGSNAKSKDWPEELKNDFLELFGGLKQTVLWKFEEQLPNLPKNVHILDWAPQQSILAHPNLRLFITHGGLLSTTETVYFGVPTIVMPYGADQRVNALRAVNKGYALMVDLSYEMARELKVAIEEMLANPKYTEKVKQLSKLYHDRVVPPGKELVHWVEHVVKTGGAPHLRSPALMLPWYQKAYLDLLALVLSALYVTKLVLTKLFCKGKSSKKAPGNKKKTN